MIHILDEADEALLRRWKGHRLQTHRHNIIDEEYEFEFLDGAFSVRVPYGQGGVPILDNDTRDLLGAYLDEWEAAH